MKVFEQILENRVLVERLVRGDLGAVEEVFPPHPRFHGVTLGKCGFTGGTLDADGEAEQ